MGEETRERSRRTRSRGLLAGRLAVKIEICTDSSMRGGGLVWRGRRGWAWKCSGPKIGEPNLPRIEFDEHSLLVFSVRPRSSFSLPVYPVSYSRFVLPSACLSSSLFLTLFLQAGIKWAIVTRSIYLARKKPEAYLRNRVSYLSYFPYLLITRYFDIHL